MAAMEEASQSGQGAVSLEGRLIDAASLRMAEHLLAKIELIEERQGARRGPPPAGRGRRLNRGEPLTGVSAGEPPARLFDLVGGVLAARAAPPRSERTR